jgi:hypothetical protein
MTIVLSIQTRMRTSPTMRGSKTPCDIDAPRRDRNRRRSSVPCLDSPARRRLLLLHLRIVIAGRARNQSRQPPVAPSPFHVHALQRLRTRGPTISHPPHPHIPSSPPSNPHRTRMTIVLLARVSNARSIEIVPNGFNRSRTAIQLAAHTGLPDGVRYPDTTRKNQTRYVIFYGLFLSSLNNVNIPDVLQ